MQPPWTISHLFLILLTVCDRGISIDLEGSEADVVANANSAQKHITERQKRLIPYKAYYVTQAQSNPIKELRGFFAVPTTPKNVESNAAHALAGTQNDQSNHQKHHHTLTIFPSTISAGKSKPYYDFEKSTNNFQIFRSIEPIHPVEEKISGVTISPQWTAPVQLIKLIPHIPGASTRKTPTQGSISNINSPRTTDPSNRSPTFYENNSSSGERKVHKSVNENRESVRTENDGRSKILLKTFTFLPNGASAVKALGRGNSEYPNKFEGSTPDVSNGQLVERKTPSNPDQPVEAKKKNREEPKTTYRGHQTPNIRLKVPQENEIRFVVNLNPVRSGHGIPSFGKHVEKEPGMQIENQSNKPRTRDGFLSVLKETNRLPKNLTPENIDSGIKTLALILERLQKEKQIENIQSAFTELDSDGVAGPKDVSGSNPAPYQKHQSFPQASGTSTPGRPGVDYPIHSTIPQTSFDCATQRYKGFFGDPETKCQVWHYCDLNGGQASFLCPNGTIFSQVALTCDWWFNVKCASTLQLYVLNERLYKYILPFRPSFPEDYTGPLVDRYLTAKFTEMERKSKLQALKSLSTTTTPASKPQQKSK